LGLISFCKTTGGKGLHVVVPLSRPLPDWDIAKEFARGVTLFMERLAPKMFTSKTGERNRKNKIFIDYLRNGFGATAVAAFSPRWRPGVGVSTPVSWAEIDDDIRGTHFDIHNVPGRIAKQRKDPWAGYWEASQSLTKSTIKRLSSD
jgi:bifunctional non-homologous end joining protein LigD